MNLLQLMKNRRSIRRYQDTAVSREKLLKVLEAGRIAPSWKNAQPWRFVVVSEETLRVQLGELLNFNPDRSAYEKAPYVIVAYAYPELSGDMDEKPYYLVDTAISLEHMVLQAEELGLGTCWVGWFYEDKIKKLLGIDSACKIVAITPLGVPDEAPPARARKKLGEIAFENKAGNPID